MRGKIVHIEDVEEGWVFLSMRDYLPSAFVVVFLVIKIMNVKKKNKKKIGCLSLDEDEFQFGPWLRAIALKVG